MKKPRKYRPLDGSENDLKKGGRVVESHHAKVVKAEHSHFDLKKGRVGAPPNAQNTLAVPNASATSNGIDLRGLVLMGLWFPATVAGANVTLQTSPDGVTWGSVTGGGNPFTVSAGANQYVPIPRDTARGIRWLRIVMGANQTSLLTVTLILRPPSEA